MKARCRAIATSLMLCGLAACGGDSSTKETCFVALYRFPAVTGSTALDCVN